jgi:hypothetical protein
VVSFGIYGLIQSLIMSFEHRSPRRPLLHGVRAAARQGFTVCSADYSLPRLWREFYNSLKLFSTQEYIAIVDPSAVGSSVCLSDNVFSGIAPQSATTKL